MNGLLSKRETQHFGKGIARQEFPQLLGRREVHEVMITRRKCPVAEDFLLYRVGVIHIY